MDSFVVPLLWLVLAMPGIGVAVACKTRWWAVPGALTAFAGVVLLWSSHHDGPRGFAALGDAILAMFGFAIMFYGGLCLAIAAWLHARARGRTPIAPLATDSDSTLRE